MHEGTYTYLNDDQFNGDKYVGEFKNNLFNGYGTYTFASGDKYVGEFKDHEKAWTGNLYLASGDKYVENIKK